MNVKIADSFIEKRVMNNRTFYYWSERPFPFSKSKRISKAVADGLLKEQQEIKRLISQYAEQSNIADNTGDFTAIFYLDRGTAEVTFETLDDAVECCRYVSNNAKHYKGFVFVWKNHEWVFHIWRKSGIEEFANRD